MPVPERIVQLVETFDRNIDAYRSGAYNEAQVRRQFIDPMFKALGWDVDNEQGWAEAYKDVIHEDDIRVGGATKRGTSDSAHLAGAFTAPRDPLPSAKRIDILIGRCKADLSSYTYRKPNDIGGATARPNVTNLVRSAAVVDFTTTDGHQYDPCRVGTQWRRPDASHGEAQV